MLMSMGPIRVLVNCFFGSWRNPQGTVIDGDVHAQCSMLRSTSQLEHR